MDRRAVLRAAGLGLLSFSVQGAEVLLTPRAARDRRVDLKVLTTREAELVETLGEALLPGARDAGIAHFIDHELSVDPADSLLMLRYLDVPPPYVGFYRSALAAFETTIAKRYEKSPTELSNQQLTSSISEMSRANPEGWLGPPAPLLYFVLRNDAVDVVYGTPEGFKALGVPYMPHIMPPARW